VSGWWDSFSADDVSSWATSEEPDAFLDHLGAIFARKRYRQHRVGTTAEFTPKGRQGFRFEASATVSDDGSLVTTRLKATGPATLRAGGVAALVFVITLVVVLVGGGSGTLETVMLMAGLATLICVASAVGNGRRGMRRWLARQMTAAGATPIGSGDS
jgi:hypothetical protein